MLKKKVKLMTLIALTSIIYSGFFHSSSVKAEGTRNMIKNSGYRPYTLWDSSNIAGVPNQTLLKVYAKSGETIYLGSSASGNTSDIVVRDPSGNQISLDVKPTGEGYIDTVEKEAAGPLPNAGGYSPLSIKVNQTGIWQVEFHSDGTGSPVLSLASDNNFVSNQNGSVGSWDITVRDESGNEKGGRVFTSYIAMYMGGNKSGTKVLNSVFYVLTKDGYVYKTDMNGVDPNRFVFFSNNRGFIDRTNNMTLYHSISGSDDYLTSITGNVSPQLPNVSDTATDITHNVFFDYPSNDMPSELSNKAVAPATVADGSFLLQGASGTSLKMNQGEGAAFTFNTNKSGSYQIIIDTNKDGVYDPKVDRVIENVAIAGLNTVVWDGKDASGNYLPIGNGYSAKITMKGGEYHFPILDAEYNAFGFKIQLQNAPGAFPSGVNKNTVYYNESNYKTANSTTVALNGPSSSSSPLDASSGIDSSNGTHAFINDKNNTSGGYGNHKGLDTWTYFPGGSSFVNFDVVTATPSNGFVSGYIFNDKDKDGKFTSGEPGISGLTVSITDKNGVIHTAATDGSGYYAIGIPTGSYTIKVNSPSGYTLTTNNATQSGTLSTSSLYAGNIGYYVATDLAVTNTVSQSPWISGHQVTYTVTINNRGLASATNVILNDALPAGIEYISDDSNGAYNSSTGNWNIGTLAVGQSRTIKIVGKINSDVTLPKSITNIATVTMTEPDTNTANNKSSSVITPVANKLPVVSNSSVSCNYNVSVSGNVSGTDEDGDSLTYSKGSAPGKGNVVVNSDGKWTYTPNTGSTGNDSFTVIVNDGYNGTAISTITVLINTPPVVSNYDKSGSEDTNITFTTEDFVDNYSDSDSNSLSKIKINSLPSNGILKLNGSTVSANDEINKADLSNLTFTPNANWHGNTSFNWSGSDGAAYSLTNARVDIIVSAVNDAPSAVNDTIALNEDSVANINVLENDRDIDGDSLTVTSVTQGSHGSVAINSDGTIKYIPNGNYNGPDSFTYTLSDGHGSTATATVSIAVNAVNDAPTISNISKNGIEDADITFTASDFTDKFADIDRDNLTKIKIVSLPANGILTLNGTAVNAGDEISVSDISKLTFTPNANWNGSTSFNWNGTDGSAYSESEAKVDIAISSVNDAPTASNDTAETGEDTSININVLNNDRDVDGDALSISSVTQALHGTVEIIGGGIIKYTPANNYNGTDSFTYTISDGHDKIAVSTVNITVNAVNDAPTVSNISKGGPEDTVITFTASDFTDKFSDIDKDSLTKIKIVSQPANGILKLNGTAVNAGDVISVSDISKLTFTPNENWNGSTSFDWNAYDGTTYAESTAKVNISIAPVNDAPVVSGSNITTNEDTKYTGILPAASDVDNSSFTYTLVEEPNHGTLEIKPDGSYTYTPDANYNGADSFKYKANDGQVDSNIETVNITVNAINDVPLAVNDTASLNEDSMVNINVLGNDTDTDGDGLIITSVTQGSHGTVVINSDGTIKYTPNGNYNGSDSFTYTISDRHGGTATGTVSVTVNSVNDAPTVLNTSKGGSEDNDITFAVSDFTDKFADIDNDSLIKIKIVSLPANGILKVNGTAVKAGDEILVSDLSKLVFTPNTNWNGSTSFNWNGYDGTTYAESIAKVNISIAPVNDVPVVSGTNITTNEDTEYTGMLPVASDVDNSSFTYILVEEPKHGILEMKPDGSYTYTTSANYNGTDSFKFKANDGQVDSNIETVNITVNAINDVPLAVNDTASLNEDSMVNINVLGNDTDTDGDGLIITSVTQGSHGTVLINSDGTIKYTPSGNYNGTDSFTYTISDGHGGTATATVSVTVNSVNDAPTVPNYNRVTSYNTQASGTVAGNDLDNDSLSYSLNSAPSNGYVYINNSGEWIYTPKTNFAGIDSFKVEVSDGHGGSSVSTITVTVKDKLNLVGTVTDNDTNKPVSNTKIEMYDLSGRLIYSTTTDSNGNYAINNVKLGLYKFSVVNSQYGSQIVNVDVKPTSETEYTMRKDFKLVQALSYAIKLDSNPVTIIGDGKSTSVLTAKVTDSNNRPVANTRVVFSAALGTFLNGNEAVTDENGIARVVIRSAKVDGTENKVIPVTATADDNSKNLHASDRIFITFEPGLIDGVVVDNETGLPISGAVVEASKDFDGDGIADFYSKVVTGTDGKYSIAIPKGNMQYNLAITKPVKIGNETVQVKYSQKSEAGIITGAGNEKYSSVNTAAGVILAKKTDGGVAFLQDYSKFTIDVVNKADIAGILSGKATIESVKGVNAYIATGEGSNGVFEAEGLEKGKDYTVAISYTFPNGDKIVVGTMDVKVGTDGQINLSSALIDPYGTITDAINHNIITGAHVKLYYADTERNRAAGRTPNTLVNLPGVPGFDPADNKNPQEDDSNGKYAYMVFPDADYYVVVEKDGYETYVSETISVGKELVKKDIQMKPKSSPSPTKIAEELPKTGSPIDMSSLGTIGFIILASGLGLTLKPKKKN